MTKEQSKAEMRYRPGKYVLKVLLDAEIITTEEAIKTKAVLLEKYDPFTRCLEEVDSWVFALLPCNVALGKF